MRLSRVWTALWNDFAKPLVEEWEVVLITRAETLALMSKCRSMGEVIHGLRLVVVPHRRVAASVGASSG